MGRLKGARVLVTGGTGFLGRHICHAVNRYSPAVLYPVGSWPDDLTEARKTNTLISEVAAWDVVIHAAAKVGGIGANIDHGAEYLHANVMMGMNVVDACRRTGVKRLINIGTTCSYPEACGTNEFRESDLWAGYPEPTNASYGIAKRTVAAAVTAFRDQYGLNGTTVILANLYGPGDCYSPDRSHVIPALIRRYCEAKDAGEQTVMNWGNGRVYREFLYAPDAAAVIAAIANTETPSLLNVGSGQTYSIHGVAEKIANAVGFTGRTVWNDQKPSGQQYRRLCCDLLKSTGLAPREWTNFDDGLRAAIADFRELQADPDEAAYGALAAAAPNGRW